MGKTFNLADAKITGERMYKLLFVLLWVECTLYAVFHQVVVRLPLVSDFADLILPFLILMFAAFTLFYICSRIRVMHLLIFAFFSVAVLVTLVFADLQTQSYLDSDMLMQIFGVFLYVFVGAAFCLKKNERMLFWLSVVTVIGSIVYQIILSTLREAESTYDMGAAYNAFPACVYLVYYSFANKNALSTVFAIVGAVFILSCGARGPILCLLIVFACLCVSGILSIKSSSKKIIAIMLLAGVIVLFSTEVFLYSMLEGLSEFFADIGASTRAIDMIIEENVTYDSGRSNLISEISGPLGENAIMGMGLMSDRAILDGTYIHNIAYEMWCNFGVLLGTVVFATFVILPIMAIYKSKSKNERMFIFAFAAAFITKLFLSSSYLYEEFLFFILGYSVAVIGRAEKNDDMEE